MSQRLGTAVALDEPFADAVEHTRAALKAQGFGILTEVDLRATFKEKLGADFRPFVMLGACNPPLAYRALNADPDVGMLLPCNVTVEADNGGSIVRIVDPGALLAAAQLTLHPELREIADDARARLSRVAGELRRAKPRAA
jgi:uncharacterized protein (DUF302 family)